MRSHGCFSNPWYLKNVPPFFFLSEFFRYNSEKWWYKEPLCTHGTQSATANQWLLNGAGHEMGKLRKSCRFNSFTTFTSHPGRHIYDMIRHSQLHLEVLPSQIHKNHLKCPCVSTVEFFLKDASK